MVSQHSRPRRQIKARTKIPTEPESGGPVHENADGRSPIVVKRKECPFCLKEVPNTALDCPECARRIAGAGTPTEFQKRLLYQELALRKAVKENRIGKMRKGLLAKFRLKTIVALGTAIVCGLIELFIEFGSKSTGSNIFVIGIGVAATALFICWLLDDLAWLAVRRRENAAAALTAFVRAISIGRYGEAYRGVLPGDHNDRSRLRRAIHALGIGSERSSFKTLTGFHAYWHPVFSTPESRVSCSTVQTEEEKEDFAMISVELTFRRRAHGFGGGLTGALVRSAMAQQSGVTLNKLVRRINGRWYLVNGEINSPEDSAMKEFMLLAAASDEQLEELQRQVNAKLKENMEADEEKSQ